MLECVSKYRIKIITLITITMEEVILQLVSSKCVPVLLYGLEACPLTETSVNSLDFENLYSPQMVELRNNK